MFSLLCFTVFARFNGENKAVDRYICPERESHMPCRGLRVFFSTKVADTRCFNIFLRYHCVLHYFVSMKVLVVVKTLAGANILVGEAFQMNS